MESGPGLASVPIRALAALSCGRVTGGPSFTPLASASQFIKRKQLLWMLSNCQLG